MTKLVMMSSLDRDIEWVGRSHRTILITFDGLARIKRQPLKAEVAVIRHLTARGGR